MSKVVVYKNEEASHLMHHSAKFTRIYDKLLDSFRCIICQQMAHASIQLSTCCRQMLGCEACVSKWFQENDVCPHCRAEGASRNVQSFSCFDELLSILSNDL